MTEQERDIIIGGRNIHNKTPKEVLQRAKDFGVTFNLNICEFGRATLQIAGLKFIKNVCS